MRTTIKGHQLDTNQMEPLSRTIERTWISWDTNWERITHWASHVHQSLSFLLSCFCLHFYTSIETLQCMQASFRSFVSLGPTGTSLSHYFSYHHITAFHHISLVVFFISSSLFYLLLVLPHILFTLSGDPPQFITWRIVTSFPLSILRTLIQRSLVWEGHLVKEIFLYIYTSAHTLNINKWTPKMTSIMDKHTLKC